MNIYDKLDYFDKKQLIYLHWKISNNPAGRKQIINPQLFDKLIFIIISGSDLALPEIKSKIWYRIPIAPSADKYITLYFPFQNVVLRLYNLFCWEIKKSSQQRYCNNANNKFYAGLYQMEMSD